MDKAQLPVLMSIMMITQAVLATPCGLRAKRSLKERNNLLLGGFGTMIIADLLFAKMATPQGNQLSAVFWIRSPASRGAVFLHQVVLHSIVWLF